MARRRWALVSGCWGVTRSLPAGDSMGSGPSGWDRCREEAAAEGQAESPVGHWDGTSLISLAGWSWTHCHLPWLPPELLLGSGKRTQRGFWREHRLKKWPGLGIRSRSPRPPISSGLGEGNSVLPLPFLLVEPPRGSVSRCVCGQAVGEVPRCGPHALAGVTWGLILCARFPSQPHFTHGETGKRREAALQDHKQQNWGGGAHLGSGLEFSFGGALGSRPLTAVTGPQFLPFVKC